jgi:phosphate transport system substrate-binding protein
VHEANPVDILAPDQVREIFLGNITNWSEVGGPDEDIIVISKAEGSATFVVFNDYLDLKGSDIDAAVIVGENVQMIKTVSLSDFAIGYVSIGSAEVNIEFGSPIKLISLNEAAPTVANVANGTYAPTRALNLVTKAEYGAPVQALIDYSKSAAVTDLVVDLTFAPVTD